MTDKRTSDDKIPIGRRNFLLGAGTAVATGLAPTAPTEAQNPQQTPAAPPAPAPEPLLTLTATEHAFFAAAARSGGKDPGYQSSPLSKHDPHRRSRIR